jgi:hypothetical protein
LISRSSSPSSARAAVTAVPRRSSRHVCARRQRTPKLEPNATIEEIAATAEAMQAAVHHRLATGRSTSMATWASRQLATMAGEARPETTAATCSALPERSQTCSDHSLGTFATNAALAAGKEADRIQADVVDRCDHPCGRHQKSGVLREDVDAV